jgi:flavin-dependent dehydrogenase
LPELYFCADRLGYGWCVRKGDFLNVGFGRLGSEGFKRRSEAFLEFLLAQGRVPPDTPARWPGHAYRIHARPARRMVEDGVLLVGDAAGLAHPVSGEGILRAVESGRLAARTILDAVGRREPAGLEAYRRAIARRYGRPRPVSVARDSPRSRLASRIGVGLMASPWFVRHVLLDRWFLHVHQPALA